MRIIFLCIVGLCACGQEPLVSSNQAELKNNKTSSDVTEKIDSANILEFIESVSNNYREYRKKCCIQKNDYIPLRGFDFLNYQDHTFNYENKKNKIYASDSNFCSIIMSFDQSLSIELYRIDEEDYSIYLFGRQTDEIKTPPAFIFVKEEMLLLFSFQRGTKSISPSNLTSVHKLNPLTLESEYKLIFHQDYFYAAFSNLNGKVEKCNSMANLFEENDNIYNTSIQKLINIFKTIVDTWSTRKVEVVNEVYENEIVDIPDWLQNDMPKYYLANGKFLIWY